MACATGMPWTVPVARHRLIAIAPLGLVPPEGFLVLAQEEEVAAKLLFGELGRVALKTIGEAPDDVIHGAYAP